MNTTALHPMIVHFPIALLITGFLFASLEIFFKKCRQTPCVLKTTYWLVSLGALSSLAAVCTGMFFTTMQKSPFFPDHQLMAFTTACVACVAAILYIIYVYKTPNNRAVHYAAYVIYLLAAVCVAITGHYGGLIVY